MAVERRNRAWVARVFTAVEDVVYVGLGLLLAGCSLALLINGIISFGQNLMAGSLTTNIVAMLDRVLLILLVVELLDLKALKRTAKARGPLGVFLRLKPHFGFSPNHSP